MLSFLVSATESTAHSEGTTNVGGSEVNGKRHFGRIKGNVVLAFVLRSASAAPLRNQDAAGPVAQEMALSNDRAPVGLPATTSSHKCFSATRAKPTPTAYSAVRTYEIRTSRGNWLPGGWSAWSIGLPTSKRSQDLPNKGSVSCSPCCFDRLIRAKRTSSGREHTTVDITHELYVPCL